MNWHRLATLLAAASSRRHIGWS